MKFFLLALILSSCVTFDPMTSPPPPQARPRCNGSLPPRWSLERGPCVCEPEGWICRGPVKLPKHED